MPVLETLALIVGIGQAIGTIGGGIAGLSETDKANKYNREMFEKVNKQEQEQQAFQNELTIQGQAQSKAAQRFNTELARRNEKRTDQDRWTSRMQNAANKYAEILNTSEQLRKSRASALTNR